MGRRDPRFVWTVVLLPFLFVGCGGSTGSPAAPGTPAYVIPATDLAEMLSEKALGEAGAPVTIVEYSSPPCPHCVTFHLATLPGLKAKYIDTAKVKLIYRDYPVQGASTAPAAAAAYAAAALARCAGNAKYFDALDLLYRSHSAWVSSPSPATGMKQALAPIGMTAEKMDACVANTAIRNEIDREKTEAAATYGVRGTPTLVIAGTRYEGALSLAEIETVIAPLLK